MENRSSGYGKNNHKMTRAERLRARRAQNPANGAARPPAHTPAYGAPSRYYNGQNHAAPFRRDRERFSLPFHLDELSFTTDTLKRAALFSILPLVLLGVALLIFTPHNRPQRASGQAAANPTATVDPLQQALKVAGNNQAEGRINILVLGSDMREGDGGFRTDTIILVSIDADRNRVGVVSFPRDLYVEVPVLYPAKINQVMALGGFAAMQSLFEKNFGVHVDHYLMTNFAGFVQIVDDLGGIEVQVGQALTDSCDLPQAVDGDCTVIPGAVEMNGPTALWYIRSRETTSDYDRLRRTQEVGEAAFKKLIGVNAITRLPELYASYSKSVQTDMKVGDIIPLLPVAAHAFKDTGLVRQASIGESEASPSWSWDGMWILLPDENAIRRVLEQTGVQ